MKQNEHVQIRDIHTYNNGNASVSFSLSLSILFSLFFLCLDTTINSDCVFTPETKGGEEEDVYNTKRR